MGGGGSWDSLSSDQLKKLEDTAKKSIRETEPTKRSVFISFAGEDLDEVNLLRGQAKNDNSPFEFVDMSVKQPWETDWESKCRTKIKGCDGVIALISKHTPSATGQLFEIKAAEEEKVPIMLMYSSSDRPSLPYPLSTRLVNIWSWPNIKSFLSKL